MSNLSGPPTPPHEEEHSVKTEIAPSQTIEPVSVHPPDIPMEKTPIISEAERKKALKAEATQRSAILADQNTDPQTYIRTYFKSLIHWDKPIRSGIALASILSLLIASSYFNNPIRLIASIWSLAIAGNLAFVHATFQYKKFSGKPFNNPHESRLKASEEGLLHRSIVDQWVSFVVDGVNLAAQSAAKIVLIEDTRQSLTWLGWGVLVYFVSGWISTKWIIGIATLLSFSLPKLYLENKTIVDEHVDKANVIIREQTSKAQAIAQQHASPYVQKINSSPYVQKINDLGQQYGVLSKSKNE